MPLEEPDIDMFAFKSINNVMIKTGSSIELVTDPVVGDHILLPEPMTEVIDSHIHEESLRPSTTVVSLAHVCLTITRKYNNKLC